MNVKPFDDPELKRICSEWERTYRYGTPEDRKQRAVKWEPYYSYVYKKYQGTDFGIVFPQDPETENRCQSHLYDEFERINRGLLCRDLRGDPITFI